MFVCRTSNVIHVPNFVQICAILNELWAIDEIQNGGPRLLEFIFCPFYSNGLFPVAAVYITAKFHLSTSIRGRVIAVVQKSKMAAAAILNYNFVILDHPRSPFVHLKFSFKFRVDRVSTFRDNEIRNFRKFGSKCLFKPPPQKKWCFWGVLTPNITFLLSRLPKVPTLRWNTRFEP